jgi:hypothetical protein
VVTFVLGSAPTKADAEWQNRSKQRVRISGSIAGWQTTFFDTLKIFRFFVILACQAGMKFLFFERIVKAYFKQSKHMKKNLISVFATAIIGAIVFIGCGEKTPEAPPEPAKKYWTAEECPVTGKKSGATGAAGEEEDAMNGNVPLQFEHEGIIYEANVWDESAMDEFEKNPDKYKQKIIDGSE